MLKFVPIFLARLEALECGELEKINLKAQILDLFKTSEDLNELILDLSEILNREVALRPLTGSLEEFNCAL